MIKNYLKTALRFLKQNKLFAGINIFGLSMGLAVSFIILLYVINELSYDHCHKNRKHVFRVVNFYSDTKSAAYSTSFVFGSVLKEKFPQIKKVVRIMPLPLTFKTDNGSISENVITADPEIFEIFTIPLEDGSIIGLLEDKNSIVISHNLANKLFGPKKAVGQVVVAESINGDQPFTVKGVFKNIPENSTFRAECIINNKWSVDYINKKLSISDAETSWSHDMWSTWVLLADKFDIKSLGNQINAVTTQKMGRPVSIYSFQNLLNVYLGSTEKGDSLIRGNLSSIRIFSAIAFLIILVAATNYIILSTAISTSRTKEIGIRKTFGASVEKIQSQFLSESLLLVGFALPIALLLMWLIMPLAGVLFQTQLHIMKSNILVYLFSYLSLIIIIGLASGFYTSSYLSRLNVLDILSSVSHSGKRKYIFRSALIVLQLIIFCAALSCALIVRAQYKYAINKDLGYFNKNILLLNLGRDFSSYPALLNSISSNPDIISSAGSNMSLPIVEQNYAALQIPNYENEEIKVMVIIMLVDFNYFKTMGMSVVMGRDFSSEYGSDNTQSVILNETAVKQLAIADPLKMKYTGSPVIGVVKDFNLFSLHSNIQPLSISISKKNIRQLAIHYKSGKLSNILPLLQTEWKKVAPERPFLYTTIEEVIENLYTSEKNLTTIVSVFALLSLVISALGLFGLTLFVTKSRTREIGIKKIFGSSENGIILSFMHENFILVIVAVLLSIPITFYFMTQWLNRFAFKTSISWLVFIIAFLIATIVVLVTVYYHSYKISRINPVKALRYE